MASKHTISSDKSIVTYNRTAAEGCTTGDSDVDAMQGRTGLYGAYPAAAYTCYNCWAPVEREYVYARWRPTLLSQGSRVGQSAPDAMKANIAKTCKLIPDTKPKIYQLPLKEITGAQSGYRKIEIGTKVTTSTKTILLVGETGAGKSTTINALVNYILNVNLEDDFRFRLVVELKEAKQARSQTAWVTIYNLYHQNNFRIPYNLTIVDTPGFNATEGLKRDEEITKQLEALFKSKGPEGLDSLDAVGFVVMSSQSRLTPTQHYIFDSILSLFGRDIEHNIFMLLTFADGNKPPALAGIEEAKIPHQGYVKINNSALYSNNHGSDQEMNFVKLFWAMGANSYQTFILALQRMETRSLTLSYEVLMRRHCLERYVEAMERDLYLATQTSKRLMVEKEALSEFAKQANDNQNFICEVEELQPKRIKLVPGESVTNCLRCQTTCCYPCKIVFDRLAMKYLCSAMTWGGSCKCCPGNCAASSHTADNFRFVLKKVKVIKTIDDMRQLYEEAGVKKMTAKQLVQKVEEELRAIEIQIALLADNIKVSMDRLGEIALKPNPLSISNYIDLLVDRARREGGENNPEIEILYAAKEKHIKMELLAQIKGNLTVAKVSEVFEQAKIKSQSSGNSYQVALISAAATVKSLLGFSSK